MKIFYCTFPDHKIAEDICLDLTNKRIIACANILAPMTSLYIWKGQVERGQEVPALLKTIEDKKEALFRELPKLHPFETPCLVEIKCGDALPSYLAWIQDSLKG